MKKNIFVKAMTGMLAASAIVPAMTSCSSDYLEETPITSISKADVAETLDGALYAMQGACSSMYRQMREYPGWNNTCGEPYYNIMYGEAPGNTYHDRIWCVYASNIADWTQMRSQTSMMANYMWVYAYGVINAANQVLDGIDKIPVTDDNEIAQRDFIKAVCLTLRGHFYTKLLQVYGPRWQDSNNGAENSGVVLRLNGVDIDVPFSTTGEVMTQIYKDLDDAIALFNGSSYNDQLIWTPDVNVAHGLKARAAAIKLDYQTMRDEARIARQGYPIMSARQYSKGGFIKANEEYMWATWFQSEGMYYDGHGGTYGCNGWTVHSWGVSCGIDFDLYRAIPQTDCRKGMYMAPGFFALHPELAAQHNLTDDSFFDPSIVAASSVTINMGDNQSMVDFVNDYACDPEILPDWNDASMPLTSAFTDGICRPYYAATYLVAGLQYKWWGVDTFATNQFPFMRASEMAYLEAEAAFMLGDENAAREILIAINKDYRDPDFTCTEAGEALLAKLKTYRHIELWGEGFTWFDYKRWNTTMHRNEWKANDPTSGNYQHNLAKDFAPSEKCGWRISVPNSEFSYNKAVSVDQLPDSNR